MTATLIPSAAIEGTAATPSAIIKKNFVEQPVTDIKYLEVHFYPDREIELTLTNRYATSRMKLAHHDGKLDK